MRRILLSIGLLLSLQVSGQIRCYQFVMSAATEWRDSSFVACTSDSAVIAEVDAELTKPLSQRGRHINGKLAAGDNNVNKNGSHNFLWHFKLNEWHIAEMSIEACDGRPYSDVDKDTAYWIGHLGQFCPWTARVSRKIEVVSVTHLMHQAIDIAWIPNPASDILNLVTNRAYSGTAAIFDLSGRKLLTKVLDMVAGSTAVIDVSELPPGAYMLQLPAAQPTQTLVFFK